MDLRQYAQQQQAQAAQDQPQQLEVNWLDTATAQMKAQENEQQLLSLMAFVNDGIEHRQNPGEMLRGVVAILFGDKSQQAAAIAGSVTEWQQAKAAELDARARLLDRQANRLQALANEARAEAQQLKTDKAAFEEIASSYGQTTFL